MSVADKLRLAMKLTGVTNEQAAEALGVKSKQIVANKLSRNSFSAEDLIRLAELMGGQWQLIREGEKIVDLAMIDLPKNS